ncbi:hypothetical protein K458DRAFT_490833 [Lentithecium fluviatile CBS 122367]|uniref:Uncharacterized protein n=1 Tax=Lentithecium fluviatile CBS 122367 TaxID=1168545 RepID=A0A6G1IM58_9PLEO|nr:hypothetical protein K458DRAFT_490833 [Lentithecium fluviatile CBS 122367]
MSGNEDEQQRKQRRQERREKRRRELQEEEAQLAALEAAEEADTVRQEKIALERQMIRRFKVAADDWSFFAKKEKDAAELKVKDKSASVGGVEPDTAEKNTTRSFVPGRHRKGERSSRSSRRRRQPPPPPPHPFPPPVPVTRC